MVHPRLYLLLWVWHRLFNKMSRGGDRSVVYEETDFNAMDMHVSPEHAMAGAEFLARGTPHQSLAIHTLFDIALSCECLTSRGIVFQKRGANPSGWYLTLWINTFITCGLIASWYLQNEPTATHSQIFDTIRAAVCGDDSIISYSKRDFHESIRFCDVCAAEGYPPSVSRLHPDWESIEYCGATQSLRSDRSAWIYVRFPRVQKLLDSLLYTESADAGLEYQRSLSILQELWPLTLSSELSGIYTSVRGFCSLLRAREPLLCTQPIPNENIHRALHCGLQC